MRACRALVPLLLLSLASCGPILGQAMRAGEGPGSFEVTQGRLAELRTDSRLLVLGPFAKTPDAFYICRGEDAANFAEELAAAGLFRTELYLERDYNRLDAMAAGVRGNTPAQLRTDLGIAMEPEVVLLGTILHRSMTVAPMRGVITDVGYRLEFFDLGTRTSVTVELSAKVPFEQAVRTLVRELAERRARGS